MNPLSISIPTYNRPNFLKELLDVILESSKKNNVDINIFDNSDNKKTARLVKKYQTTFKNLNYFKNKENLGYVLNQIQCIKYSKSKFTAFLCDDDIYKENAIKKILKVIRLNKDLAFIALNYYSFTKDYTQVKKTNFAPEIDIKFDRAYDLLNYKSVGHFSGFIFNTKIAQKNLKKIEEEYKLNLVSYFEKYRGIVTHLAHISLSKTNLPSYFIGKRLLCAREPENVDYDLLYSLNYNNLIYYNKLFSSEIINKNDYLYREKLVLKSLPKAIFIESTIKSRNDYDILKNKFDKLLFLNLKYRYFIRPLFSISQCFIIKMIWSFLYKIYKHRKK